MRVLPFVIVLLASTPAFATLDVQVVVPANGRLDFGDAALDVPSATQRITIRNIGDVDARLSDLSGSLSFLVTGSLVVILKPGEEASWDIACDPSLSDGAIGEVQTHWCVSANCDLEAFTSTDLACFGGFFNIPRPLSFPPVYAEEHSQGTVSLTNREATPITITAFAVDPQITVTSPAVPFTVPAGGMIELAADFDASAGTRNVTLDLLSGQLTVARANVVTSTLKQIQPENFGFEIVPQGAVYTRPITIHNSSHTTRTITNAAFDLPDFAVSNVIGRTLAASETIDALVTLSAATLGSQTARVTLGFDSAQGDTAIFRADVVPPMFALVTGDATPDDGWLDFGTVSAAAGPVDATITIVNKLATDQIVAVCFDPALPFEIVTPCPSSIAASGSVTMTLRLHPGEPGDVSAGMVVGLAGVGGINVVMQGRVVDHGYAASAPELTFDGPGTQTITVTNRLATAVSLPVAVTADGFRADPPAIDIPAGGTADVTVTFSGTSDVTGELAIGAAGDPDRVVITLTGNVPEEPPPPPPPGMDGGCCQSGAPGGTPLIALVVLLVLGARRARSRSVTWSRRSRQAWMAGTCGSATTCRCRRSCACSGRARTRAWSPSCPKPRYRRQRGPVRR